MVALPGGRTGKPATAGGAHASAIALLLVLALAAAACGPREAAPVRPPGAPTAEASDTFRTYASLMTTEPAAPAAGQPVTLVFAFRDDAGVLVPDLEIVHEKPVHLVVVSDDLAYFDHIHPERRPDGTYAVQTTFPAGGAYRLYAGYRPLGGIDQVGHHRLDVAGPTRVRATLAEDVSQKVARTLRVSLRADGPVRAGAPVTLRVNAQDAATREYTLDLEPYLGAVAHFVAVSEDGGDFLHVHPHEIDPATFPDITAQALFPRPGLYKLWAQFQRRGAVETAAFVIRVEPSPPAEVAVAVLEEGVQEAHVTVSEDGYAPSRIALRRGVPARIVFYREADSNCGEEVVFPSLGRRASLRTNAPVAVGFTPEADGEIAFTCGMNMYRGSMTVSAP